MNIRNVILKGKRTTLIIGIALAAAVSAAGNIAVIKKVLGGDLVQVSDAFVARLTGIVCPSRSEALGNEIFEFTKKELEGRTVKLVTWTRDNTKAGIVYDEKGNAFVLIFYGKEMSISYNEVLLKKGYARVDPKCLPDELKRYNDLEKEAREKGLGIWKARMARTWERPGDNDVKVKSVILRETGRCPRIK